MTRITLHQLTPDLVRESGAIVAFVRGQDGYAPIRRNLQLPKMYAAGSAAQMSPDMLEVEVPDFERATLKKVQDRLAELGLGFGLEPLPSD